MSMQMDVRRHQATDLATGEVRQGFVALDKYAEDGVVQPQSLPTLAKISAGYKNDDGYPVVSRDGTIYLSDPDGRAPGLVQALRDADRARRDEHGKVSGSMRLSIALPFDDLNANLSQAFVRYSAGRLEAQGDADAITELVVRSWRTTKGGGKEPEVVDRVVHYTGTPGFKEIKATCQVVWNLLFTLGRWVGEGEGAYAEPLMSDGLGVYRLTSTSRKGLYDVGQYLELVSTLCHGRLRGIVMELMLAYPPVADPLGVRRTKVPRWTLLFKPPTGIVLNPTRWQELATGSLREGAKLALPEAPRPATWEEVERDMRDLVEVEPGDEAIMDQLLSGDLPARAQEAYWREQFFGQTGGSSLSTSAGRKAFIGAQTHGRTNSLATLIASSTNGQMQEFLAAAVAQAARERVMLEPPAELKPADQQQRRPLDDAELAELQRKAARWDEIMANWEQGFEFHSPEAEPGPPSAGAPDLMGVAGPEVHATGTVELPPAGITATCLFCNTVQQCSPEGPDGYACLDSGACKARVAAAALAPQPTPTGSPETSHSPTPGEQGSLDTEGRPLDSPVDIQGVQAGTLPEVMWRELHADTAGGEFFNCAACGTQVSHVSLPDERLDARTWLLRITQEGLARPLCLKDARAELRARERASRARSG